MLDMRKLFMPIEYELIPSNPISDNRFEYVKIGTKKEADSFLSQFKFPLLTFCFSG